MGKFINLESRISIVFLLSVLQVYLIRLGSSYLPLALFSVIILCPDILVKIKFILKDKLVWLVLGLAIIQLISLFWSEDVQLGLKSIIYNFYFIALFGAVLIANQDKLISNLTGMMPMLILLCLASAILFFRIYPEAEIAFIKNEISGFLINPNVQEGLKEGSIRNNILDPRKAGAIFINANVAGCYLAMVAFFLFGVIKKQMLSVLTFFVFIFSAYATGSKTVLIISLFASLLIILVACILRKKEYFKQGAFIGGISLVCAFIFYSPITGDFLEDVSSHGKSGNKDQITVSSEASINSDQNNSSEINDELKEQTEGALGSRILLWKYALQAFDDNPLMGQGFGGWQAGLPEYVDNLGETSFDVKRDFPPHNTFIYIWSQSGLLALIIVAILICWLVFLSSRLAFLDKYSQQSRMVIGLTMVWLWLTIHGMGDNTGPLGEVHQIAILAISLGMLSKKYNVKSRGSE